jgi:hypothetical protein
MAIPSGLSAQVGVGEESTYGTPATADRFYPFTAESLSMEIPRMESAALRGTRVLRSDRWASGKKNVSGDLEFELLNKSFGRVFKHMFGSVVTSQPDGVGAPTVYLQTFTPGDLPTATTVQVGRPDVGGTVRPFTYHGCRVNEWSLNVSVGEFAKLTTSMIGEDEDTATALATASYPTSTTLLNFVNATLTVGGGAFDAKSVEIKGSNGLADDRYFLGSALRKQPLEAALRDYTGSIEAEFTDLTAYNRFTTGTEAALVLLLQGTTIATTYKYEVKFTLNVRYDGETPQVGGPEILKQTLPFKAVASGATPDTAIKLEYQTTDTTP